MDYYVNLYNVLKNEAKGNSRDSILLYIILKLANIEIKMQHECNGGKFNQEFVEERKELFMGIIERCYVHKELIKSLETKQGIETAVEKPEVFNYDKKLLSFLARIGFFDKETLERIEKIFMQKRAEADDHTGHDNYDVAAYGFAGAGLRHIITHSGARSGAARPEPPRPRRPAPPRKTE
jgi:hypothetical protein